MIARKLTHLWKKNLRIALELSSLTVRERSDLKTFPQRRRHAYDFFPAVTETGDVDPAVEDKLRVPGGWIVAGFNGQFCSWFWTF